MAKTAPDYDEEEEYEKTRSSYFATPVVPHRTEKTTTKTTTKTTSSQQEYFKDRIQASRQRALLAGMEELGSIALNVLNTSPKSATSGASSDSSSRSSTKTTTTKTPPMDAVSVAARQEYFKDRIQASRQRALLANIMETKAPGGINKITTSMLRRRSGGGGGGDTTEGQSSSMVSPQITERRQRNILAAQLSYNSPAGRALRKRQQYFRTRIESTRQRALLAGIANSQRMDGADRKTTMASLSQATQNKPAAVVVSPPPLSPSAPSLTPERAARQQEYFRDRIEAARQRALLANIATTKAAGNQLTTATLKKSIPEATVLSPERCREQFQRALLASQLAQTPLAQQQRRRRAYFQTRVRSSRQRALLDDIASTKAAGDRITTASFKMRRTNKNSGSPAVQLLTNKQDRKAARQANREARRQMTRQQIESTVDDDEGVVTADDSTATSAVAAAAAISTRSEELSPLEGDSSTGKVRPETTPIVRQQPAIEETVSTTSTSLDEDKGQSTSPTSSSSSSDIDTNADSDVEGSTKQQSHPFNDDEMMKKEKYGKIKSVGERAYVILKDLGMI